MVSGTVEALERWYSRVSIKVSLSAPRLLCEKYYRDRYPDLGPESRKSRELFGPEKAFVKLRTGYSVKLVFSYVINRSQIKITAKFRASRGLRFEDTKRIMSPEMRPKSFGTFEKQAPGQKFLRDAPRLSLCYWLSRSIKLPHTEVLLCTTLSFSQGHFPAPLSPN